MSGGSAVHAALSPLVEFCRRCSPSLPVEFDRYGLAALGQTRGGASSRRSRVEAVAVRGTLRWALGLPVIKAGTEPGFFEFASTAAPTRPQPQPEEDQRPTVAWLALNGTSVAVIRVIQLAAGTPP